MVEKRPDFPIVHIRNEAAHDSCRVRIDVSVFGHADVTSAA
jgi:hypothetical protein